MKNYLSSMNTLKKGEYYSFLSFYIILIEIGVWQLWQHKDGVFSCSHLYNALAPKDKQFEN